MNEYEIEVLLSFFFLLTPVALCVIQVHLQFQVITWPSHPYLALPQSVAKMLVAYNLPSLEWKNISRLVRTLTLTKPNTSSMNWIADCMSGLLTNFSVWQHLCSDWLNNHKSPHALKSSQTSSQKSRGYYKITMQLNLDWLFKKHVWVWWLDVHKLLVILYVILDEHSHMVCNIRLTEQHINMYCICARATTFPFFCTSASFTV